MAGAASKRMMIQPSHKGRLHKALGIPAGEPISRAKEEAAARSKDPHLRAMARFALSARGFKH